MVPRMAFASIVGSAGLGVKIEDIVFAVILYLKFLALPSCTLTIDEKTILLH